MPFVPNDNLLQEHRRWLAQFDPQHGVNWEKSFRNDPEAAMCEAAFRRLLENEGCEVEPNEDVTGRTRAPDFACKRDGTKFYVEVTCISISKAAEHMRMPERIEEITTSVSPGVLTDAVFDAVRAKASQCADQDGPVLLGVGTFHQSASFFGMGDSEVSDLLTGHTYYSVPFTRRGAAGIPQPRMVTELRSAACLRPDGAKVGTARCSISGILLGGFGLHVAQVRGVLHPEAARPFDRRLLPSVRFCRLVEGYRDGKFATEWLEPTPKGVNT